MGWEMMQYKEYAVENRSNKRESSREKNMDSIYLLYFLVSN